jgi:hypothetical protein
MLSDSTAAGLIREGGGARHASSFVVNLPLRPIRLGSTLYVSLGAPNDAAFTDFRSNPTIGFWVSVNCADKS